MTSTDAITNLSGEKIDLSLLGYWWGIFILVVCSHKLPERRLLSVKKTGTYAVVEGTSPGPEIFEEMVGKRYFWCLSMLINQKKMGSGGKRIEKRKLLRYYCGRKQVQ